MAIATITNSIQARNKAGGPVRRPPSPQKDSTVSPVPMNTIDELVAEAFSVPRTPCSPEYQAGVRVSLAYRLRGTRIDLAYPVGTAQADAFFAGLEEGHAIWRNRRADITALAVPAPATMEARHQADLNSPSPGEAVLQALNVANLGSSQFDWLSTLFAAIEQLHAHLRKDTGHE